MQQGIAKDYHLARYFFHIRDEQGLIEDTEGLDLTDASAVAEELKRSVAEYCQEATPGLSMEFEVTDAEGRMVQKCEIARSLVSARQ